MRMLRVELARLLARRAVRVLLIAAVLIPTVVGVARVLDTTPPPADEIARAEARAERAAERPRVQRDLQRCLDNPGRWGIEEDDDAQALCEEYVLPSVDWYLYVPQLDLVEEREAGGMAVVVALAMILLLMGTTYAGHDWATGSLSNQLLFQPRRYLVWAAKAVALTLLAGLVTMLVTTVWWLAIAAAVQSRDGWDVHSAVLLDSLQSGWRGAAVATGAGLAGYALAMLFRSTVASLGAIAGIAVAGGILLATIGIDPAWDPALNALAIVQDGATYWVEAPCDGGGGICEEERVLSLEHGVATLGIGLLAAIGASLVSFGRRDVP